MTRPPMISSSVKEAAGSLLLLHALLSIIMQIVKYTVPPPLSSFFNSGVTGYVSSALIMQGICILLPTLYIIFHYRIPSSIIPGPSTPSGGWIILSATIGLPAAIVFTGLNNGYVYILTINGVTLPSPGVHPYTLTGGLSGTIVAVLLTVLLPGIVEELMFRGIIQGSMESLGRRFSAIAIPAVTFAVFHENLTFIVAPLLAGFLLGYIRHKTGTVYASILTHIVMNLTILLMNPLLPQITSEYVSNMTSNAILYASLLSACVAAVALIPMLISISSIKSSHTPRRTDNTSLPIDYRYVLGFLILMGSMLFYYFTNS